MALHLCAKNNVRLMTANNVWWLPAGGLLSLKPQAARIFAG